jgi:rubrerythrin
MDTELDPHGIMQIAEEIEYRRIRLYQRVAPLCADTGACDLCRELLAWSRQQVSHLTGLEARWRAGAPPQKTACGSAALVSDARVMAALAFFVAESATHDLPAAVTREWMLTDAVGRSRQAIVFYQGLKAFARDRLAQEVMSEILQQEDDHLHRMLVELEPYRQARHRGGQYLACVC